MQPIQRRQMIERAFNSFVTLTVLAVVAAVLADELDGTPRVVALGVVGLVLAGLSLWKLPQWQAEAARRQGLNKTSFEIENESRATLAQAILGLFILFGVVVTWQELAVTREEQRITRREQQAASTIAAADREAVATQADADRALAREGQLTDRFTAAVEQLGSSEIQIRLGGIYGLERIARDSRDDAPAVLGVLTAFVRELAPWTPGRTRLAPDSPTGEIRPATDVQAVLGVIGRGRWAEQWGPADGPPLSAIEFGLTCLDLSGTDLRGARWNGTSLLPLCLMDTNLEGAIMVNARLHGARMGGANLRSANLGGADLELAELMGVSLAGADLRGANLSGAIMVATDLSDADLRDASLRGADLRGALFGNAKLLDTDLRATNLTSSTGLTPAQVEVAIVGPDTLLPPEFSAPAIPVVTRTPA